MLPPLPTDVPPLAAALTPLLPQCAATRLTQADLILRPGDSWPHCKWRMCIRCNQEQERPIDQEHG